MQREKNPGVPDTGAQNPATTEELSTIVPDSAADLRAAAELIKAGVPIFVAKARYAPDGSRDWSGGAAGYDLPRGWQHTAPDLSVLASWQPGDALCAVQGHSTDGIDVDTHKGGSASLEVLRAEGAVPPPLAVATTPSGGLHLLVASTGQHSKDGLREGLDLKAGGPDGAGRGFLFIAPTMKLSKGVDAGEVRPYRWLTPPSTEALRAAVPSAETARLAEVVAASRRPAAGSTAPAAAASAPTDPARAASYAKGTLEGLREELAAAAEWPEGHRDEHARGWEKLVADAAYRVGRLARTPHTGVARDTGLDVLRDIVPAVMHDTSSYSLEEKWHTQRDRGAPFDLPSDGPEVFGLTGTPGAAAAASSGGVVDPRRGNSAMHAQSQFADGLATRAAGRHMYVAGLGWHYYDGRRWREDADNARAVRALRDLLRATAAANIESDAVLKSVRATSSATALDGVLRIARTTPELACDVEQLDAAPHLLNLANGTLDLNTLELRPHDPADTITKVCRASWSPGLDWRASRWATFLTEVLPDGGVRAYLQRYVGLALLGEVLEHKLLLLTGTGRNGKGVAYGAISWALGDYAVSAEPELFLHREGAHPTGQMDLRGARWVVVSETEAGRRLADATVKRLTGGDAIRARRMAKDFVQFEPSHTAAMVTNHLPRVSAEDEALWARLRVVPFDVVIPAEHQDVGLPRTLRAEADAVLAWAVEGLAEYRRVGMAEPAQVVAATSAYRDNNDLLAEFLEERTERVQGDGSTATELHNAYRSWCDQRRIEAEGRKTFGEKLRARGYATARTNRGITWRTLKVVSVWP